MRTEPAYRTWRDGLAHGAVPQGFVDRVLEAAGGAEEPRGLPRAWTLGLACLGWAKVAAVVALLVA